MFQARLCHTMDLSDDERRRVYTKRLANAKITHANWAVRKYAVNLRRQDWISEVIAIDPIVARSVFKLYGVHPVLLDYAVKELQRTIGSQV